MGAETALELGLLSHSQALQHHTDDFLQTDELLANRKSEVLYKEKYTNVLSPT